MNKKDSQQPYRTTMYHQAGGSRLNGINNQKRRKKQDILLDL